MKEFDRRMYNKVETWLESHRVISHILIGLEGLCIGMMFAAAI